jgi:hypothetical protein
MNMLATSQYQPMLSSITNVALAGSAFLLRLQSSHQIKLYNYNKQINDCVLCKSGNHNLLCHGALVNTKKVINFKCTF